MNSVKEKSGDNSQMDKSRKEMEFKALPLPQGIRRSTAVEQNKKFVEVSNVMIKKNIELIQSIGTGNYTDVYFGLDYNKCKQNGIKVIDLKKASANYRLKFLQRELKVLQRVKHKNIIKIYEIVQSDNKIFVCMEFAISRSLADYLQKNGPFCESDSQELFKSVLDGLRYMHALGIAHRDIKADNILLHKHFVPKLTDFSHSRHLEVDKDSKVVLSQTFCGSVAYFPPQILQLQPYHPLKYDIWSTGVVLYLMLFNVFPFNPENESEMLSNQLNRNWDFKQLVSDLAKDVLKRMLEPEEDLRCNTTTLFMHKWLRNVKPMFREDQKN